MLKAQNLSLSGFLLKLDWRAPHDRKHNKRKILIEITTATTILVFVRFVFLQSLQPLVVSSNPG
jgi:hypothetical protein